MTLPYNPAAVPQRGHLGVFYRNLPYGDLGRAAAVIGGVKRAYDYLSTPSSYPPAKRFKNNTMSSYRNSRVRGRRRGSRFSARYRRFGHRTRMVPRRRRPLRRPRRTFRQKRRSAWMDMANNRSGPLFYPRKLNAKFHWHHEVEQNPLANLYSNNVIKTANAYEPYPTSTHQPRGWDQLNAIYTNYEVIGVKVTVSFRWSNPDVDIEQNPALCYLTRSNATANYPETQLDLYEKAMINTKWKKLVYGRDQVKRISMYCPAKEFFADKSATSNVAAMTAAPPATGTLSFGCVYDDVGGALTIATIHAIYYVCLSSPIDQVPVSTV